MIHSATERWQRGECGGLENRYVGNPGVGVRIQPSPRFLACQPVNTLRPAASRCFTHQFLVSESAAPENETLLVPTPYPPGASYIYPKAEMLKAPDRRVRHAEMLTSSTA